MKAKIKERAVESPLSLKLDDQAAALVRCYSEQWGNKLSDVVNGALHFTLGGEEMMPADTTIHAAIDAVAGRRLGFDILGTKKKRKSVAPASACPVGHAVKQVMRAGVAKMDDWKGGEL